MHKLGAYAFVANNCWKLTTLTLFYFVKKKISVTDTNPGLDKYNVEYTYTHK